MQLLNNGKLGKLQWCCIKILVFAKTILYLAVEQFLWRRNFTCAVPLNGRSRCHNYEIMIAGAVSYWTLAPPSLYGFVHIVLIWGCTVCFVLAFSVFGSTVYLSSSMLIVRSDWRILTTCTKLHQGKASAHNAHPGSRRPNQLCKTQPSLSCRVDGTKSRVLK